MDCDNHTKRGRAGIYIHTSCTMQAHIAGKVNAYLTAYFTIYFILVTIYESHSTF